MWKISIGGGVSMFGFIGVPEGILIIGIILIVFGAGKLPQVGKALGDGIKNFKRAVGNDDSKDSKDSEDSRHV